MKYVLVQKDGYREYRGYVFNSGHPVEITDRGTLEAIKRVPFFEEYQNSVQQEKVEAPAKTPVLAAKPAIRDKRTCPKCGKKFKKNLTMHERFCKA